MKTVRPIKVCTTPTCCGCCTQSGSAASPIATNRARKERGIVMQTGALTAATPASTAPSGTPPQHIQPTSNQPTGVVDSVRRIA